MAKYTKSLLEILQEEDALLKQKEDIDNAIVCRLHHFDDIFPVSKANEAADNDEQLIKLRASEKDIVDGLKTCQKRMVRYLLQIYGGYV